jgi:hypothetical protein
MAVYKVNNIIFNCNLNISETKTEVMAFDSIYLCRSKIVVTVQCLNIFQILVTLDVM